MISTSDWTFNSPHLAFETPLKALRHNQFLPSKDRCLRCFDYKIPSSYNDMDHTGHNNAPTPVCSQHFRPTAAANLTPSIFVQSMARSGVRYYSWRGSLGTPAGCTWWARSKFSGVSSSVARPSPPTFFPSGFFVLLRLCGASEETRP